MPIKFTRDHNAKSADTGLQFECFCGRCGNGYESMVQTFAIGMLNEGLNIVANLPSSVFGGVHSAAWHQ